LGFATFWCKECWTQKIIHFTCKRRFCSSCSKPLCDKRVNNVRKRLPTNISYMHITFTLPEELRDFWLKYRDIWVLSVIFQVAQQLIKDFFLKRFKCEPWIFSVIHTFWSSVNRNPHLHFIVTLWGIYNDSDWNKQWKDVEGKYISFGAIKNQRRAFIIKALRKVVKKQGDEENYKKWNRVFKLLFEKDWYVRLSEPILDVVKVMNYVSRYMYRAPVSITKIIDSNLTDDPYESTITIKYMHKRPVKEMTISYTIFDFLWMIARQLPDKNFRVVRYAGIFAQNKRKHCLEVIQNLPRNNFTRIPKRPISFVERLFALSWKNPLQCTCCGNSMELISITYVSKRTQQFHTKYFDTS